MDYTSIEKLCMGCLKETMENNRFCTKCGFDNEQPKEPHYLPPRSILAGKYLVGRVLGEGGFGITYLGFDLNLNIKVAIKEYFPAGFVARAGGDLTVMPFTGTSAEYYTNGIEKFLNEARSLARFHNLDGIVEVRDFFRENGTAYIVMEFVDGANLRDELERKGGRMGATEVFSLMRPLVFSLDKVHQTGVVHRDISPDNIMLTTDGRLKLLDFGAARDTAGNKSVSVVLKPGYAPEEQYRTRGELGAWTDIYALCGTMYKLITGVTPPESIERLVNDTLTPPSKLGVAISPAQEGALMRGLSVHKENRFASMGELFAALYGGGYTPQTAPQAPAKQTAAPSAVPYTPPPQGGQTFAPQAGQAFAPQGGQAFAPQGGQAFAPSAQPAQKGGFKKLWNEKKGLLLAGAGGFVLLVALIVVLLTLGGGKSTGGEALTTPGQNAERTPGVKNTATPIPTESAPASTVLNAAFTDPGHFFTSKPIVTTSAAGTVYTYEGLDSYAMLNYLTILGDLGYAIDGDAEGDVLNFTVSDGRATVSFSFGLVGSLADLVMTCPPDVALSLSQAPVTERYLESNGIDADQWLALGATTYYSGYGVNYMGTSNVNSQGNSTVTVQGDMLYLADTIDDAEGIFQINMATGDAMQLVEDNRFLFGLNVSGDYLYYYADEDDENLLYRIKTDGSELTEPIYEDVHTPLMYGDYLYFIYATSSGNKLMRMSLTTLNTETVLSSPGFYFNISGGRIYAADSGSSTGIYSYALDGGDEKLVSDVNCYGMAVHGGWIYYVTSADEGSVLRRMDVDGTVDELIVDESINFFCPTSRYVFYNSIDSDALKCRDMYTGTTSELFSYGMYPALAETASGSAILYFDSDGDTSIYNIP